MKPLELYIHIPFCKKKCSYCDFLSFPAGEDCQERYLQALLQEIGQKGKDFMDYEVSTIFFGGGTPSYINADWIRRLMEEIRKSYRLAPDTEITMECNPGTLTEDKLRIYHSCGINRLSIGLQSTDDRELELLGRIHTYKQFLENYALARRVGFDNINVDLISSLPGQKRAAFAETLRKVMALRPEHISVYSLIIEPGTPFYERYQEDAARREKGQTTHFLPDEEEELETGRMTCRMLEEEGYSRYEISNYQRDGFCCRHNVGYWTGIPYLGLGLGASSYYNDCRYVNYSDMDAYLSHVEQGGDGQEEALPVDASARMEEFMFLGLRMKEGVSLSTFESLFGCSLEEAYPVETKQLVDEQLLKLQGDRAFLTEKGLELANYCMAMFLKS